MTRERPAKKRGAASKHGERLIHILDFLGMETPSSFAVAADTLAILPNSFSSASRSICSVSGVSGELFLFG